MRRSDAPEAGFTLLEVLIVLAIVAAMSVILSASIVHRPAAPDWPGLMGSIAREAERQSLSAGTPLLLLIAANEARLGQASWHWDSPAAVVTSPAGTSFPAHIVFENGRMQTVSGPLVVTRGSDTFRFAP